MGPRKALGARDPGGNHPPRTGGPTACVRVALLAGLILGCAGGRAATSPDRSDDSPPPRAEAPSADVPPSPYRKVAVPEDAPSSGPKHAKVTIVEWSDFECHYCGYVNSTLAQLKEKYGEDVRVVFRHLPMLFHPNAKLAAEASMAAHEQGRFWEYHDQLFAHQRALDRTSLERYAQELKLDMGRFRAALDSGKFRSRVEADMAEGEAVGVLGTPTFFINGYMLSGAQPFDSFGEVIDAELARADQALRGGVKRENLYHHLIENLPAPTAKRPGW